MSEMIHLIEVANKIIQLNKHCLLSGSMAINLQGYKTRREPNDIDLWLPSNEKLVALQEMEYDGDSDHYEEIDHHRTSFKLGEIKIDVFTPVYGCKYNPRRIQINGIAMVRVDDILKFKLDHVFDEIYEDEGNKHCEDFIFILNSKLKTSQPA